MSKEKNIFKRVITMSGGLDDMSEGVALAAQEFVEIMEPELRKGFYALELTDKVAFVWGALVGVAITMQAVQMGRMVIDPLQIKLREKKKEQEEETNGED